MPYVPRYLGIFGRCAQVFYQVLSTIKVVFDVAVVE